MIVRQLKRKNKSHFGFFRRATYVQKMQIITFQVAKLRKPDENSGLGIALEGTVEVEDGKEVRPHHYIRDIQTGGPVGLNGVLQRGDELLEVGYYAFIIIMVENNVYLSI